LFVIDDVEGDVDEMMLMLMGLELKERDIISIFKFVKLYLLEVMTKVTVPEMVGMTMDVRCCCCRCRCCCCCC
jgi:hypothetical protein